MNKKNSLFIFSIIGLISLFLPYSKNIIIGCGIDGGGSIDYYYDPLVKYLFDFFAFPSITYLDVFDFLAIIVVIFSLVFTPVLFFFSKKNISLLLVVLTLGLMLISIYNSFDLLGYGYYIILLQQTVLLIIISTNNFNFKKQ